MLHITRLALKDFRGHTEFAADLGRLTLVRGANGVGKTSLANALEWLLAGRVTGLTDAAGKGAEALLVRGAGTAGGAKKAVVEAHVAGFGPVVREVPNRLRAPGLTGGVRDAERELYALLDLPSREVISFACNPSALVYASADESRDLLFSVLTGRLTRQELLDAVADWLGSDQADTTAAVADAALEWAKQAIPERPGVRTLDQLYRSAYDSRREANGAVRTLEQQVNALLRAAGETPLPEGYTPDDLPRVRQRLAEYQREVQELQQRIWQAEQLATQRQAAEQKVEAARAELDRIRADVRAKTGLDVGEGRPGDAAALRARIQALSEQIRHVQRQTGMCPVYAGVACPLPAEVTQQHLASLKEQRRALTEELAHVVVHDAVVALRQAEAERDGITVPDVARDRERLANLQRLIQQDTELLQRLSAAAGRKEGIQDADARLTQARFEAAKFDILTRCFEPGGGVRALLLRQRLAELEQRVNRRLAELLDASWRVRLSVDGPHPILVSHPKHGAAILRTLSHAERTLVAAALLDAMNDYHRLGILILDDAEHISGGAREYLLQVLAAWAKSGRYGNIIVILADDTPVQAGVQVEVVIPSEVAVA